MTQLAEEAPPRSAAEMINLCFRHQHPEAYGRPEVPDVALPRDLRYGAEETIPATPILPEEPMGHPEAIEAA
jgi:hypothetical protein